MKKTTVADGRHRLTGLVWNDIFGPGSDGLVELDTGFICLDCSLQGMIALYIYLGIGL